MMYFRWTLTLKGKATSPKEDHRMITHTPSCAPMQYEGGRAPHPAVTKKARMHGT